MSHSLPGNPHFHQAGSAIGAAQMDQGNVAKSNLALARAMQAQTHEQRTANLLAEREYLRSVTKDDTTVPDAGRRYLAEINQQITDHFGVAPDLTFHPDPMPEPAGEPAEPSDPESIRDRFGRAYFYDVDGSDSDWVRVGKDSRGDGNVVVLSAPRAQNLAIAQENAPALAAAILMSVGLDPATTVLPTEVAQSV